MSSDKSAMVTTACAMTFVSIAVLGTIIRISVQDTYRIFTFFYYALPFIVMAFLLLIAGVMWIITTRIKTGILCIALSLLYSGIWINQTYFSNPCHKDTNTIQVFFWNTARGFAGCKGIMDEILEVNADIIGLVETARCTVGKDEFLIKKFPEYNMFIPGGGIAVLAKGKVLERTYHEMGYMSRYARMRINLYEKEIIVLVVDLNSSPFIPRENLISQAFNAACSDSNLPAIIMGDFNTPIDSKWFNPARNRFFHFFETGGTGFLATWPTVLPVFALDHIWASKNISVSCAKKMRSVRSDHLQIKAELTIN